jgi:hypothetical protein
MSEKRLTNEIEALKQILQPRCSSVTEARAKAKEIIDFLVDDGYLVRLPGGRIIEKHRLE